MPPREAGQAAHRGAPSPENQPSIPGGDGSGHGVAPRYPSAAPGKEHVPHCEHGQDLRRHLCSFDLPSREPRRLGRGVSKTATQEGREEKPDLVAYANGLPPGAYRARLRAGAAASEPLDFAVEGAARLRLSGVEPLGGGAVTLSGVVDLPQGGVVQLLVLGLQGEVLAESEEIPVQGAGVPVSATVEGALEPGITYEAVLVTADRSGASERVPFAAPDK